MTSRFIIRPYVCALVVLSLCAPMVAVATPAVSRDRRTEYRALAAPSSIVLLTRADVRQDHPRRPSTPVALIPVPLRGGEPDLVRLAAATKGYAPRCLFTAGPRTERSPPTIS
jgi:hypothetical protein